MEPLRKGPWYRPTAASGSSRASAASNSQRSQASRSDSAEVVAAAEHRVIAQRSPQDVEGVAQLVSGVVRAALRPDVGQQLFTTQRAGMLDGQQGQQSDALPQGGTTGYGAVGPSSETPPSSRSANMARA